MMEGYKTLTFAALALLAEVFRLTGYEVDVLEVQGLGNSILALLGIGGAIYGRIVAKKEHLNAER